MRSPAGPSAPKDDEGESVVVEAGDVSLHTVQAGPADGPLAVLLHGFPEFWYAWNDQVRPLATAGYRVVVPDQRGYNFSDRPDGVDAYRIDALADDVTGLVDALGRETAHLVGHDWGAAVAWWTALHDPEYVETLTAVNVPHPTVLADTLRRSWRQRLRSWYALFFQLPALPERVARAGDWALLVRTMHRTSLPGTFSPAEFDRYRAAWDQPGAFEAMVNWYRALGRRRDEPRRTTVEVPTLVVWGCRDEFLARSMAHESVDHCRNGRVTMIEDATHWVQHEHPARVADLLLDQFA
ncbi:MAG: alpha/beta fold hydrolase [Haloferacaceae archaeon]